MSLFDVVEAGTAVKPFDLLVVVGVFSQNFIYSPVVVVQNQFQWGFRREILQSEDIYPVLFLNQVVVLRIGKGQGKHTLFLEVCFVNSGKRAGQYGPHSKVTRLHCGMLAGGSFPIIFITNHYGTNPSFFLGPCGIRYRTVFSGSLN